MGAILTLAVSEASIAQGIALLGVYALGLGIPFLLVAIQFLRLNGIMFWMKRHLDRTERIMGLLLWIFGLMMLVGQFSDFSW